MAEARGGEEPPCSNKMKPLPRNSVKPNSTQGQCKRVDAEEKSESSESCRVFQREEEETLPRSQPEHGHAARGKRASLLWLKKREGVGDHWGTGNAAQR